MQLDHDRLRLARGIGHRWAGMTAGFIGALERGEIRWPNAEYREALRTLFGRPDVELGLYIDRSPQSFSPSMARPGAMAGGVITDQESATDVASSGSDGDAEHVNRRELLRLLSISGGLIALPQPPVQDRDAVDDTHALLPRVDPATLEHFYTVNGLLWRTFMTATSKAAVQVLVVGQVRLLMSCLGSARTQGARHRLCALIADMYQLAGEIAFDRNRHVDAAQCYTLAASAASEAAAYDLWACALVRHAFIGVYERDFAATLPMLDLAANIASQGDSTLSTRYWVDVVRGQALAGAGEQDACQRALDAAEDVVHLTDGAHNGGWLRFDGTRLAEERGPRRDSTSNPSHLMIAFMRKL